MCLKISADNHLLLRRESWPDFIDTEDLVEIRALPACISLAEPAGLINVGGNKVCPETVEKSYSIIPGSRCCPGRSVRPVRFLAVSWLRKCR